MKTIAAAALAFSVWVAAQAQIPQDTGAIQSFSGQFVAFPPPRLSYPLQKPLDLSNTPNFISLRPALLTISCERIKQALARRLGATMSPSAGKIFLRLRITRSTNDPITVVSQRVGGHWQYQVGLPDFVEQDRFVRAIVQVILLEMANRHAGNHSAEIPTWLASGLARELAVESGVEFVLPPPSFDAHGVLIAPEMLDGRRQNPLAHARDELLSHAPLTFSQLSWPTNDELLGPAAEAYRCSAQLFVHQLLHLKNGRECLRAMLAALPSHFNWQTSFFEAFNDYFQDGLDVEKWWALQLVQFTGRDLTQTWTPTESIRELDQILQTPVEVHTNPDRLPHRATISLQTVVRKWNGIERSRTLERTLRDLNLLRLRVAQDLIPLVDDYRSAITAYLQAQGKTGHLIPFLSHSGISDAAATDFIRRLNALDARRAALPGGVPQTGKPKRDPLANFAQANR